MKKAAVLIIAILLVGSISGCSHPASLELSSVSPFNTPSLAPSPLPETPVPTAFIPSPSPSPTAAATPTAAPLDLTHATVMYVTHRSVNVRTEASVNSERITSLTQNTQVNAYKKIDDWYYIQYADGQFGYMNAAYLSDQPVIATPLPEASPKPEEDAVEQKYNSNVDINDNVFLDALEYTGYNLKKHREDGNMWVFILGKHKQALGYLSGLGYDYGVSSGYETTAAGAPDIAKIKKNGGLVCASYVTYVYFNYLPNIAGIDTSSLTKPANSRSAQSWRLAAEDWVTKGLSRKISFSAKRNSDGTVVFHPDESIPIGSIVVFKVYGASDSADARHVGIYAGYAGGYHWMTHVGNERGPEMITIERMGFSSTPEVPLEVITPPISFERTSE
jgi:SH3 domain protein